MKVTGSTRVTDLVRVGSVLDGEAGDEPALTEVGARFALGSTTFQTSVDDSMFGVVAHAESGYSLGACATVSRVGLVAIAIADRLFPGNAPARGAIIKNRVAATARRKA